MYIYKYVLNYKYIFLYLYLKKIKLKINILKYELKVNYDNILKSWSLNELMGWVKW